MQTNSTDISNLDYQVLFDISGTAPLVSLTNLSSGPNLAGCTWWFVLISPSGTVIHQGSATVPDETGAWTAVNITDPWPQPFGQIEWSATTDYSIEVFVKDSDEKVFSLKKTASICRPNGNTPKTKGNYGEGKISVIVECNNARLLLNDESSYSYQGVIGDGITKTMTVTYPADGTGVTPAPFTVTNTSAAIVPISFSAPGYQVIFSSIVEYDFAEGVSVQVRYKFRKEFAVACDIDLCPIACEVGKLQQELDSDTCDNKGDLMKKVAQINLLLWQATVGKTEPLCGIDVASTVEKIKEIGGFDCNCYCGTGIVAQFKPSDINFEVSATCGDIKGTLVKQGNNYILILKDKSYVVQMIETSATQAFKFTKRVSADGCTVYYELNVNLQTLVNEIAGQLPPPSGGGVQPMLLDVLEHGSNNVPPGCPGSFFPVNVYNAGDTSVIGVAGDAVNMVGILNTDASWTSLGLAAVAGNCKVMFFPASGVTNVPAVHVDYGVSAPCSTPIVTITDITQTGFSVNVAGLNTGDTFDVSINGGASYIATGLAPNASPYLVTGLNPDTAYSVRVRRNCANGGVVISPAIQVNTLAPLVCNPVTGVQATIGAYNASTNTFPVTVSWNAVAGAATYTVTHPGGPSTVPGTSVVFDLAPNQSFNGTITTNCTNGGTSTPVPYSGTTGSVPTCAPVSGVIVTYGTYNAGDNTYPVTVSWSAVGGASTYTIDYPGGTATIAGTSFEFDVAPGTSFNGTVTTNCSNGQTSAAVPFNGTTPAAPTCDAVTGLTAINGVFNAGTNTYPVTVSWNAVTGATSYTVTYPGGSSNVSGTSFNFNMAPSSPYSGTVTTNCSNGMSASPVPYSGNTPPSPTGFLVVNTNYTTPEPPNNPTTWLKVIDETVPTTIANNIMAPNSYLVDPIPPGDYFTVQLLRPGGPFNQGLPDTAGWVQLRDNNGAIVDLDPGSGGNEVRGSATMLGLGIANGWVAEVRQDFKAGGIWEYYQNFNPGAGEAIATYYTYQQVAAGTGVDENGNPTFGDYNRYIRLSSLNPFLNTAATEVFLSVASQSRDLVSAGSPPASDGTAFIQIGGLTYLVTADNAYFGGSNDFLDGYYLKFTLGQINDATNRGAAFAMSGVNPLPTITGVNRTGLTVTVDATIPRTNVTTASFDFYLIIVLDEGLVTQKVVHQPIAVNWNAGTLGVAYYANPIPVGTGIAPISVTRTLTNIGSFTTMKAYISQFADYSTASAYAYAGAYNLP